MSQARTAFRSQAAAAVAKATAPGRLLAGRVVYGLGFRVEGLGVLGFRGDGIFNPKAYTLEFRVEGSRKDILCLRVYKV